MITTSQLTNQKCMFSWGVSSFAHTFRESSIKRPKWTIGGLDLKYNLPAWLRWYWVWQLLGSILKGAKIGIKFYNVRKSIIDTILAHNNNGFQYYVFWILLEPKNYLRCKKYKSCALHLYIQLFFGKWILHLTLKNHSVTSR